MKKLSNFKIIVTRLAVEREINNYQKNCNLMIGKKWIEIKSSNRYFMIKKDNLFNYLWFWKEIKNQSKFKMNKHLNKIELLQNFIVLFQKV